jgi:hypothetical protein
LLIVIGAGNGVQSINTRYGRKSAYAGQVWVITPEGVAHSEGLVNFFWERVTAQLKVAFAGATDDEAVMVGTIEKVGRTYEFHQATAADTDRALVALEALTGPF